MKIVAFIIALGCIVHCAIADEAESNINQAPTKQLDSSKPQGDIIGGIALLVNGDPITLYEIQQTQTTHNLSKEQALDFLVAQRLKNQEIKRLNIKIDDTRLEQEMESIAAQNQMTYQQFVNAIYREGLEIDTYKKQLKDQIETRELMRNVLLSSDMSNEDEMRKYYDTHKSEFITPTSIQTTRYTSKDPKLLERTTQNPMLNLTGVEKVEENLEIQALNPQIAQLFSSLQEGSFSPVLDAGNGSYVVFLIQKKSGEKAMDFDEARNIIAQKLAQTNQEHILNEYFEKIKLKADIEHLRE